MYPQLPTAYALARHHYLTADGDNHAFVLTGHHVTASFANAVALANQLASDYTGNMFFGVTNLSTYLDAEITWNNGGTLVDAVSTNPPVVGGDTNPPVSPQVAILIRKTSGLLGRHFRGRMYLPSIGRDHVDSAQGFLLPGAVTAFQAAADAYLAAAVTSGTQLTILHRNVAVLPTPVISVTAELQVATQRRRNRKAPHH